MKASRPTAVHSKTEIINIANIIRVTGILEIIEIVCLTFFHPALFNRSVKIINDCLAPFFFFADEFMCIPFTMIASSYYKCTTIFILLQCRILST